MKYTTNYNLKKPEATDLAAISDLNDNADTIDTEIKTLNTTFVRKEFRTGSTASYKELTDNNFTDAEKAKLALLSNSASGNEDISVFNGLTASFYGDSLTEVNQHYTKGYHSWIKDILGLASYNNYGVSGYKVSDVYTKANSITDTADVIFVMCGVNDQTFSVDLGEWGDTTTDTTYGAFYCLCNLLKTKYPTKTIIFITPHYQTKYPHSSGITSYEIGEAMKKTCDKFSIPCYDNRVMSGIYTTNLSTFTTDNCHWNDKGHELVGKNLAKWVIDNVRYVYGATVSTISVTGVSLNKTSLSLVAGSYETLTATVSPSNATNKNVVWSSSDASIATVVDGKVTAVKAGSVTITVTTEDGSKTASCSVEVTASTVAVTGVSLNKSSLSLGTGAYETLTATVLPANATNKNVTWTTSDSSIAIVENGVVTAINEGNVTITVTTEDGDYTASCSVVVEAGVGITHGYEGLYCHVAKCYDSTGLVHLTMTVKVDDDIKAGTKITWDFEGSETNKMVSCSHSINVGVFESDTYEADDGVLGTQLATCYDWIQTVTDDGKLTVNNADWTLSKTPSSQYLKVPIALYANVGASFKIAKLRLYANGVEKQIIKCGACFDETKARIYFSRYGTTEE